MCPPPVLERPLKVCFISPLGYGLYRPETRYPFGGAEVQFFLLANALAEDQDFQVSVLATVAEQSGTERYGSLTLIRRQGRGRLPAKPATRWGDALRAWPGYASAFAEMRALLRAIDADVYLHAGAGAEAGAYALICRLLHRRFIYVVASSADLSPADGQSQGPLAWLFPVGLRLTDAVVCRTREQLVCLKHRYRREGILIRTGHPIPPTPHASRRGPVAPGNATGAPHAKPVILWVGRLHPLKQPGMFLDLAERLPGERYVMVGMRDARHQDLLHTIRARAARLPNVSLHEDVPWNETHQYFEQAKLLVNTSTYEGFPNTFVQAAQQGTPIVSWKVDPDSILARHRIGVCAASSVARLVRAAEEFCHSPELRAEFGARAREYARAYHDLDQSARALKRLVRELAVQRGTHC